MILNESTIKVRSSVALIAVRVKTCLVFVLDILFKPALTLYPLPGFCTLVTLS